MENPIKMDDLRVPPFQETSIFYTFEPSNRDERRDLSKNGFGLEKWGPKGAFVIELGRHVLCSELGSAPLCGPGSNMKP